MVSLWALPMMPSPDAPVLMLTPWSARPASTWSILLPVTMLVVAWPASTDKVPLAFSAARFSKLR